MQKVIVMNPDVDTSYVPDKEKEEQIKQEREAIKLQWLEEQEKVKNEEIDITYSYWDGKGHRKQSKVKKGSTIEAFLYKVQQEWKELKRINVDNLMFVKEDTIIPHVSLNRLYSRICHTSSHCRT